MIKISILINSRNRIRPLLRCLESIIVQEYKNLEIIVLDDNSTLYNIEQIIKLKAKYTRLNCIRSEVTLGVSAGRNLLMKNAAGDVFCFIDDDAYFDNKYCISTLITLLNKYPNVGIFAFKIIESDPGKTTYRIPFKRFSQWINPELKDKSQYASYYLGGCHAIRKAVIQRCGFYRDDFFYGEEELDLSFRAIGLGFNILYSPGVVVHHRPCKSVVNSNNGKGELYYHICNRIFIAYKYLPMIYVLTHLTMWLSIYFLMSVKRLRVFEYFKGLMNGVRNLPQIARTPINCDTMKYLKKYHGRHLY